jgi:hypothetical protein
VEPDRAHRGRGRCLVMWKSARLFGLLNMALADGYIATFKTKYDVYKYWRPMT